MPPEKSFTGDVAKEGIKAIFVEGIKSAILWALPAVLTIATLAAGYLQEVPWVWILCAATFVFAAVITGLLRFDEWRYRRTASDKLIFQTIVLGCDYVRDPSSGKPTALNKTQVGIVMKSLATFSLSYLVDEISSSIDSRINPNPKHLSKGGLIGAMSDGAYRDDVIAMDGCPLKEILEGTFKVSIRYGRKGNEKYLIAMHLNLIAHLDPMSNSYPSTNWTTVAE